MQKIYGFAKGKSYASFKAKRYHQLVFLMRLSVFTCAMLLFTLQLFAYHTGNAQNINAQVKFEVKNESLKNALKKLQQQTGFILFYPSEKVDNYRDVTVSNDNRSIAETLKLLLVNTNLSFKQQDNHIILFEKIVPIVKKEAPRLVIGKVVDTKNQPIAGANVRLKTSSYATVTNAKGEFSILTIDEKNVLQFSYIGYLTQEIAVKDLAVPAVIILKEDISHLDEVQVVGYGTTTKRFSTGDQTSVTAKQIENYPVSNVLSVLQGTVPGLFITQSSGNPGSTFNVNIRGNHGIKTGSDPLYVIDGIPYQGGSYTSQNNNLSKLSGDGYDALSFINPQDIESVSVLKDADATAIYGSRGASGVILITTKKGKPGATKVDVNVYSGISKITRFPQLLNTQKYLEMRHEGKANDNSAVLPKDYDINGTWDTTRYTNWPKLLLDGTGHTTSAQASVSGGNNNTQYLISGNYRDQTNVQTLIGGQDQSGSLHFNINNISTNNKFYIGLTGGYNYDHNSIPNLDLTNGIATLAPDAPALFNPDGSLNFQNNTFSNPLVERNLLSSTSVNNLTSSLVVGYKILTNLEIKATLGYNRQDLDEFFGTPTDAFPPIINKTTGTSQFTYDVNTSWSMEPQIDYNTKISKGLLSATLGSSLQKETSTSNPLLVTGYSSDLLLSSISAGTNISPAYNGYDYEAYKFAALFGRINYNWDSKYILNFSGRYDGSSKFGENRRYHLFGAAGGAWIFSQEDFFKDNLPFISFGKLRGSYGITGNDQIGNYYYLENYASSSNPYQGIPGLFPSTLPNPNLSWESVAKAEIGLELEFFKGRISINGDYFRNTTTEILSQAPLSSVTGFTAITENIPAKVQNQGFDLILSTVNVKSKDFTWSSNFTFTRQRNKLISDQYLTPALQYELNEPVGFLRVFRFAGVNPQTGIYQFYAKNGSITTNPVRGVDDTGIENLTPNYFGSFQNSFNYKGFTLDFLFRYVKQIGSNQFGQSSLLPPGFGAINEPTNVLARWQKPGDITNVQRYSSSFISYFPYVNAENSDHAFGDASYIRLQNLSLGYRFSKAVLDRLHLQGLRVYVEGENLLTISRYGSFDPENQSANRMPPLRIFTTGLQVTL